MLPFHKSAQNKKFSKKNNYHLNRPLFTSIFRPKMVYLDTDSILRVKPMYKPVKKDVLIKTKKNSSLKTNQKLINRGVLTFSNPGGGLKPVVMSTAYEVYCRLAQIFAGIWEDSANFTPVICNISRLAPNLV